MKKNVGSTDKNIRIALGFIFLILGYTFNSLFYVAAAISFFTGLFKFCGLYKLLGINTCNSDDA